MIDKFYYKMFLWQNKENKDKQKQMTNKLKRYVIISQRVNLLVNRKKTPSNSKGKLGKGHEQIYIKKYA